MPTQAESTYEDYARLPKRVKEYLHVSHAHEPQRVVRAAWEALTPAEKRVAERAMRDASPSRRARDESSKKTAIVRWVPSRGEVVYYRAEKTGKWKPSYSGATPEVLLSKRGERDDKWRHVYRDNVPMKVLVALRDSLKGTSSSKTVYQRPRRS